MEKLKTVVLILLQALLFILQTDMHIKQKAS